MIERLIRTLRALAARVDVPPSGDSAWFIDSDELAREFADALLLASDCPQLRLTDDQRDGLFALDDLLERMTGETSAGPWTPEARRAAPEWQEVRERARAALLGLGHAVNPAETPPPRLT